MHANSLSEYQVASTIVRATREADAKRSAEKREAEEDESNRPDYKNGRKHGRRALHGTPSLSAPRSSEIAVLLTTHQMHCRHHTASRVTFLKSLAFFCITCDDACSFLFRGDPS